MEIGINLFCCDAEENLDIDKKIKLMLENGFYHTFTRSDDSELTDEAVKKLKENNIVFDFLHLPFKGINSLYTETEEANAMLDVIYDGIEKCSKYEIPLAILHLSGGKNPPYNDIGSERYFNIMEKARLLGVKIAFENLRTLGNLALTLEKFEDALFCWDTGHESCFASGRQYMPLFGNRLGALHIHDNRGIPDKDDHMLPYDGTIDFERVARQLSDVGFDGTLMLEVVKSRAEIYDNLSVEEFYKRASVNITRLLNQVAAYKTNL